MELDYKVKGALKKNKKKFFISIILWLLLVIVFVVPFTYSIYKGLENGLDIAKFIETLVPSIMNPFVALGNIFNEGVTHIFIKTVLIFTTAYSIAFFKGFKKSYPKNEFVDIEHGSSDWSQKGEQYKILSKTEGLLLAEDNYLPLDKRGNINVLVVGRFRFW